MEAKENTKKKKGTFKYSKKLDKYREKILFPKKVEKADEVLRKVGLPKQLFKSS